MVELNNLSAGMRVKIVDNWSSDSRHNKGGGMDGYLGKLVTITYIKSDCASIKEDEEYWSWYPNMIDYIVFEDDSDFEPASQAELTSLICGDRRC